MALSEPNNRRGASSTACVSGYHESLQPLCGGFQWRVNRYSSDVHHMRPVAPAGRCVSLQTVALRSVDLDTLLSTSIQHNKSNFFITCNISLGIYTKGYMMQMNVAK